MEIKDFDITSVTTADIRPKIDVVLLEDLLNEMIQLSDYGKGIKQLFFIFLVVPEENDIHENLVKFHEEDKVLEVALRLPYESIITAKQEEVRSSMALLFLSLFDLVNELLIPEVNFGQLKKKVEEVFNEKRWIK